MIYVSITIRINSGLYSTKIGDRKSGSFYYLIHQDSICNPVGAIPESLIKKSIMAGMTWARKADQMSSTQFLARPSKFS